MNEMELTPEDEIKIQQIAAAYQLDSETLRYYIQFGPGAPQILSYEMSRKGRRGLKLLGRRLEKQDRR